MGKKKMPDSYEVGYGKPPKATQYQKGVSGNPRGRPKKALDVDHELIRESKSLMTITENGQRKRITKHEIVIKQLMKQAMSGSIPALRVYFAHHQEAHERIALAGGHQPSDPGRYNDARKVTDEELMRILAADLEQES